MTVRQRNVTLDDLLVAIGSLTDHIKTLVTAVDDLRCEVEWQARNASASEPPNTWAASNQSPIGDYRIEHATPDHSPESGASGKELQLLTAAGRLEAFEQMLVQGPRGIWLDEWSEADDFEMPIGRVIAVDAETWSAVLDMRPAHLIGEGCYCEEGESGPYLLAWRTDSGYFLRELTDEEASRLQMLCLECQAEQAPPGSENASAKQLDLF